MSPRPEGAMTTNNKSTKKNITLWYNAWGTPRYKPIYRPPYELPKMRRGWCHEYSTLHHLNPPPTPPPMLFTMAATPPTINRTMVSREFSMDSTVIWFMRCGGWAIQGSIKSVDFCSRGFLLPWIFAPAASQIGAIRGQPCWEWR